MAIVSNQQVSDLIYWRDPRKTGIVLASLLAILLSLATMSLISVVSYASLTALTLSVSFRLYKNVLQAVQKSQDGHPFQQYLETDISIPPEKAHQLADNFAGRLNAAILELRRLFLVEDLVDSVKFALLLWVFTYIGAWFNGLTLVILGVVGVFTLPKVYETHQDKIDHHVGIVKGKLDEAWQKVHDLLPIGKKPKSQ